MQFAVTKSRMLARVLRYPTLLSSTRLSSFEPASIDAAFQQSRNHSTVSRLTLSNAAQFGEGCCVHGPRYKEKCSICSMVTVRSYSAAASIQEAGPTAAVKEFYDKMLKSIKEDRSCPPNAWRHGLIENCKTEEDVELLFDIMHELRVFRLWSLKIYENYSLRLCVEITKACLRAGATGHAKKILSKHNTHGFTPSIQAANQILLYAREHNDKKLLVDVMKLIVKNDLCLAPSTADIVFSTCYKTHAWKLFATYLKMFQEAKVKLKPTSFDTWMEFASNRGYTKSLWEAENLRSESVDKPTLASGFSCAKGLLLEQKPEESAAVIQHLSRELTEEMKSGIITELQKLANEWPSEVLSCTKKEDREVRATALQSDIPKVVSILGMDVSVNLENLTKQEGSCLKLVKELQESRQRA